MQLKSRFLFTFLSTLKCWFYCIVLQFLLTTTGYSQSNPDSTVIAPVGVDSLAFGNDLKSKIVYSATDSIIYDIENEIVYMYGDANIDYEDIHLQANFIALNFNEKVLLAHGLKDSLNTIQGKPQFKQGNDLFNADTIRYNFETKKGKIAQITTKDGDSYIHGAAVKKDADNTTFIKDGYYTTCEDEHPHYFIASKKIKVIPNNKVVTGPAELFIADVPTPLAIPFGFFPNKKGRSSGILFPAYGESTQLGFFLTNGGYYFGISDYIDLSLTGDIYSRGSYRLNASSSYINRYHYNGNFSVNYSFIKNSQKELPDYSLEEAFFIRWNHSQDPKARPNSNFSANVNAGSSTFYRNNLSSANNFLTNTFTSSINYSKSFPGKPFSYSVGASHTQNTATNDISIGLPTANFAIARQTPFKSKSKVGQATWYEKIGISYSSNLIATVSTKDSLLFQKSTIDQIRYGIQHQVPINTSFTILKYFNVSPSLNYSEKWYLSSVEKSFNKETQTLNKDTVNGFNAAREFSFSSNLNTRIFGMLQFKKGKIKAIRHVITPNIGFSWRPDFSESNWGYYKEVQIDSLGNLRKYSKFEDGIFGGPGSGKSTLLTFNIDNNLEMKVKQVTDTSTTDKKIKLFESIALSGAYNFAADSLKLSMIGLSGRATILDKINMYFTGSFDPYQLNESGQRIDRFIVKNNSGLARLNNASFSVNFALLHTKKDYKSDKSSPEELAAINKDKESFIDYTIPFNLNVGYNIFYQNNWNTNDNMTQTLNFNGDVQVTENWKVTFNSGYDFEQKDLSYTSLGIYRNLHCWEMRLNWVPFGFQQNYFFQINVKSSVLQDLKLTRKNDRFDQR